MQIAVRIDFHSEFIVDAKDKDAAMDHAYNFLANRGKAGLELGVNPHNGVKVTVTPVKTLPKEEIDFTSMAIEQQRLLRDRDKGNDTSTPTS